MRANRKERHVSGAERIVTEPELEATVQALVRRALEHPKATPDSVRISIDTVDAADIVRLPALDVVEVDVADHAAAVRWGIAKLGEICADPAGAWERLCAIRDLRGALLVDAATGADLHPDPQRGVRVSALDHEATSMGAGKEHHREALALATKVAHAPGIAGELCISDDPDYTTGYLTAGGTYFRIPHLKPAGSPRGGRIFFYSGDAHAVGDAIEFLQSTPVLVVS